MYAVISTGGKQERVAEGDRVQVEKLTAADGELTFTPVLLVDGDTVIAKAADLAGATVSARGVGGAKGPRIRGFTYRNKTNQRRNWVQRRPHPTTRAPAPPRGGP